MNLTFNREVAAKYGILEAIILHGIEIWTETNKENDVNFHDGSYWVYNTVNAWQGFFNCASKKQIRTALEHLRDEGIVKTGCYNEMPQDRTLWYALTDKGISICRTGQFDDEETAISIGQKPDRATPFAPQGTPLPIYNTINNIPPKENIKRKSPYVPTVRECEREFVEDVWPLYPRKQGKERAIEKYIMHRRRGTTKEEVIEGIEAYKRYIDRERVGKQFVKQGSTFFSQQAWKDDWGAAKSELDEVFR